MFHQRRSDGTISGLDHRFGHLLAHPDLQLSQLVGKVCDFMNPTKILSRLAQTMIKAPKELPPMPLWLVLLALVFQQSESAAPILFRTI